MERRLIAVPLDPGLRKVAVIGSGPIVIGQAAEFDYAGTQACRALREEGVEVLLINTNPATIMTDPDTADSVFFEPLECGAVSSVLERERPQGILGTLGGQAGLNLTLELWDRGVLADLGVRPLGTPPESIRVGEDRRLFREAMLSIGLRVPESLPVEDVPSAVEFVRSVGLPVVIRPAFTLGGTGGGMVRRMDRLEDMVSSALAASPCHQALVEVSVEGWLEIEFEVVRDRRGHKVLVCGMENLDPMGVHTGDSVVVAPIMTLDEGAVGILRDATFAIADAVGVQGACNVQFAVNPGDPSDFYVIEINPRASRSSALASKATGYPIARVAAKVALGYGLDEIPLWDGGPMASEPPAVSHVALKFPRWPFDKFPDADRSIGVRMRSTGEVMGLGDRFEEAFVKALRGLDLGGGALWDGSLSSLGDRELLELVSVPNDRRIFALLEALSRGMGVEELSHRSGIRAPFLEGMRGVVDACLWLAKAPFDRGSMERAKSLGIGDSQVARLWGVPEESVRTFREAAGLWGRLVPVGGVEGFPYTYRRLDRGVPSPIKADSGAVMVVGSGPIRIGQGIEFDCCSVRALRELRRLGIRSVMVNNNPETVSTDHDEADLLCFEPLDMEVLLDLVRLCGVRGVLAQFGGQRGLQLAMGLAREGVPVLGVEPWAVEATEDRRRFYALLDRLGIDHPAGAWAESPEEAMECAMEMGFPLVVRPSFVLGGLGMEVVSSPEELSACLDCHRASGLWDLGPLLLDQFVEGIEAEVDVLCDGRDVFVPGVMEHLEGPGVHSGDSVVVLPHRRISQAEVMEMARISGELGRALKVRGLFNVQFVAGDRGIRVLEVNLRSSRTVPFVSKACGLPLVDLAVRLALGEGLGDLGLSPGLGSGIRRWAVKVPVFSTGKLPGVEVSLGPNMRSTGEVMGLGDGFEEALLKGFRSAGAPMDLPVGILVSLGRWESGVVEALAVLAGLGCPIYGTPGTCGRLVRVGVPCRRVDPLEGIGMVGGEVGWVVNTRSPLEDRGYGFELRRRAAEVGALCVTRVDTLVGLAQALSLGRGGSLRVG